MVIGSQLFRVQECSNSMAWAKEHMNDAQDGAIFIADVLTRASGRDGRTWQWYPGQLAVTILLKPPVLATMSGDDVGIRLKQLNMALALGLLQPLGGYGVGLKWPNDLMAGDKKIGGLLMHLMWHDSWPKAVVLGFAINVNNVFEEHDSLCATATSLKVAVGHEINMRDLYKKLLTSLDDWYATWRQGKFDEIYRQWRRVQQYLGKKLTIHQKDGTVMTGTFVQVLPNGDVIFDSEGRGQQIVPFCVVQDVFIG